MITACMRMQKRHCLPIFRYLFLFGSSCSLWRFVVSIQAYFVKVSFAVASRFRVLGGLGRDDVLHP